MESRFPWIETFLVFFVFRRNVFRELLRSLFRLRRRFFATFLREVDRALGRFRPQKRVFTKNYIDPKSWFGRNNWDFIKDGRFGWNLGKFWARFQTACVTNVTWNTVVVHIAVEFVIRTRWKAAFNARHTLTYLQRK